MKVVDIHPEELIDKLTEGTLTSAERERLDAHLAQCSSCRFEIAVRADLAEDAPAAEERPQLKFAGGTPRERVAESPRELPTPQISHSVRARSRRRWPLVMLAAALVLCAGGAMGAVITGAVSGKWLPWSPQPPVESSVRVVDAKASSKLKRPGAAPASALTAEAIVSAAAPAESAAPASSVASVTSPSSPSSPSSISSEAIAVPTPVAVSNRSALAPARARRVEAAAAPSVSSPAVSAGAFPDVPVPVASSTEGAAPRVDAASLFADANRARRDGNADRAVGLYRTLQSRYPNSSESELSRALLAQLLLERGNPEAALAGFDRYLAEDAPVLSAEALVGRARALEQLGKATQAAVAWRQVLSRFPGSVHARLAETRLAALGMR